MSESLIDSTVEYVEIKPSSPPKYKIVEKIILTAINIYFPYVSSYFIKQNEGKTERYELAKVLLKAILIVLLIFFLALFWGAGYYVLSLGTFDLERYVNVVAYIFAPLIIAYYVISAYLIIKSFWF